MIFRVAAVCILGIGEFSNIFILHIQFKHDRFLIVIRYYIKIYRCVGLIACINALESFIIRHGNLEIKDFIRAIYEKVSSKTQMILWNLDLKNQINLLFLWALLLHLWWSLVELWPRYQQSVKSAGDDKKIKVWNFFGLLVSKMPWK